MIISEVLTIHSPQKKPTNSPCLANHLIVEEIGVGIYLWPSDSILEYIIVQLENIWDEALSDLQYKLMVHQLLLYGV